MKILCIGDDFISTDNFFSDAGDKVVYWSSIIGTQFLSEYYCEGMNGRTLSETADIINIKIEEYEPNLVIFSGGINDFKNELPTNNLSQKVKTTIDHIISLGLDCIYLLMPMRDEDKIKEKKYSIFAVECINLNFSANYKPILNFLNGQLGVIGRLREDMFIQDLMLSSTGHFFVAEMISKFIYKYIIPSKTVDFSNLSGVICANQKNMLINIGTKNNPIYKEIHVNSTDNNVAKVSVEWRF